MLANFLVPWMIGSGRKEYDGVGWAIGDPQVMAPEVMFGAPPSVESDRYSMAASLLRALGARHPCGSGMDLLGATPLNRCLTLSSADWTRLVETELARLPPSIQDWIRTNLNTRPAGGRAGSARRVGAQPAAAFPQAGKGVAVVEDAASDDEPVSAARWMPWLWAIIASVALLFLALAAWQLDTIRSWLGGSLAAARGSSSALETTDSQAPPVPTAPPPRLGPPR